MADTKLNFIKSGNSLLKWKQIEVKNGRMFMRFKRRSMISVREIA